MKQKLTVKNEGSPERCEICHKSDYLEANNTICLRCQDIDIPFTLSKYNPYKEEEISGLFFCFGRTRATKTVATLLAVLFSIDIVGLIGTAFLIGGVCSVLGTQRLINIKLTHQTILQLVFNLILIGSGLTCSYFSGLELLKMIGRFR